MENLIWHPYTQAKIASPPIPIVSGEGAYLFSADGKRYIDAISSWWVNLHGHAHPEIAKQVAEQANTIEHLIFADFTHAPAMKLANKLINALPYMGKVFFSDNGSTAVEIALKMALQYWWNQNSNTKKTKILSFNHGYHGDTFGAMSAAKSHYHRPFWPHLIEVEKIDIPTRGIEERSIQQLTTCLSTGTVACFIFEPQLLGAGGMKAYSISALDQMIALCQAHQVLTIADEVMTGFGRLGPLFACDGLQHKPDIVCLSKGITGGFMPLGATLCKQFIFDCFYSEETERTLLHGHSYTGNPLACVAALASWNLLTSDDCQRQRTLIESHHRKFAEGCRGILPVKRIEVIGTILVLEYDVPQADYFSAFAARLKKHFLNQGILLRPIGNVLYVMPPYCIKSEDLHLIYQQIETTLRSDTW